MCRQSLKRLCSASQKKPKSHGIKSDFPEDVPVLSEVVYGLACPWRVGSGAHLPAKSHACIVTHRKILKTPPLNCYRFCRLDKIQFLQHQPSTWPRHDSTMSKRGAVDSAPGTPSAKRHQVDDFDDLCSFPRLSILFDSANHPS